MNTIKQLIEKYCPDGVEYKKLGEVAEIVGGRDYKHLSSGNIPVYGSGGIMTYVNDYAYNRPTVLLPRKGSISNVFYVEKPFWNVDTVFYTKIKNELLPKYLYYYICNCHIEKLNTSNAARPALTRTVLNNIEVPVPPLPVQREIVRILDNFTSLEAELEAELEARRKQYEYYRDQLLSFKHLTGGGSNEVEWKTLGEVFEMRNGYTPSKSHPDFWEGGTIPWFRMEDIRTNGRRLSDSILHITDKGIKGKGLFEKGTFILATTATIGEHALLIVDSLANQRFTNLKIRKSLIDSLSVDFVFYYMFIVDEFCKKHTNKSGFESVDMKALIKMPFPIPPLSVQRRIVSILDRFESLVNDISSGLPAEIAARHQQYEYYRDQLLTFKRKS